MKLTPNQLKAAAIKLCLDRGQNPEEVVNKPNTDAFAVRRMTVRWRLVMDEIKAHLRIHEAIAYGMKYPSND